VISGWVVVPLVLCAVAAIVLAVLLLRERRSAAERDAHERELESRIADLEAANAAVQSALDEATLLAAVEPESSSELDGDVNAALTDAETGLFNEQFFRVTLETRVSAARRHLRPVAVVLVLVARGVRDGDPCPTEPAVVTEGVRATLRDADTACRLDDGRFALILEDTPENGAVWTVERIRRALAGSDGGHTLWAGIACYPAHAFDAWELFDRATRALEAAREWQQDRIEVATAD
jgi:diguanylate cyclase (GGDEF)-like protein